MTGQATEAHGKCFTHLVYDSRYLRYVPEAQDARTPITSNRVAAVLADVAELLENKS